jgi:hypothetical protein
MKGPYGIVRFGCQDATGECVFLRPVPGRPYAGERERAAISPPELIPLFPAGDGTPLVETLRGD